MASNPTFPLRRVALIGKYRSPEAAESLGLLADFLSRRNVDVLIEAETAACIGANDGRVASYSVIGKEADAAIVVGGDGTLLNAARHLAAFGVPLVGVNQGRLGFMTDVSRENMLASMDDLLAGRFSREDRFLLEALIERRGTRLAPGLALNDIVLSKANPGRMIEFELHIDGEFIYVLRADGMIVATPTGSTAYALSANGPILHPQVSAIALVPLCPHALTNRPILVGDRNEIEIRIVNATDSRAHFDGQVTADLRNGDVVRIRRSEYSICFLHPPGYSYFAMLRQKLHWSERPKGH